MKRIPITTATATQLAEFASASLGLDVNLRMGADKIRAAMSTAGYAKDFIEVDEPELAAAAPVAISGKQREYVTILIQTQETAGGSEPVPVSVNGRAMWIERGKPQRIPVEYEKVLRDAVKLVYDPDPNGGLQAPRSVLTYPYSVLSGAAA